MTPLPSQLASLFLAGLPGQWEWLIILFIILLLFGRRLPGVARSLGQGISSFKKGLNEPVEEDGKSSGKQDEAEAESEKRESEKREAKAEQPSDA